MHELDLPYSTAPRCLSCGGRALLTEVMAERLVNSGRGRLEAFICPESNSWHVWSPDAERPRARAD